MVIPLLVFFFFSSQNIFSMSISLSSELKSKIYVLFVRCWLSPSKVKQRINKPVVTGILNFFEIKQKGRIYQCVYLFCKFQVLLFILYIDIQCVPIDRIVEDWAQPSCPAQIKKVIITILVRLHLLAEALLLYYSYWLI